MEGEWYIRLLAPAILFVPDDISHTVIPIISPLIHPVFLAIRSVTLDGVGQTGEEITAACSASGTSRASGTASTASQGAEEGIKTTSTSGSRSSSSSSSSGGGSSSGGLGSLRTLGLARTGRASARGTTAGLGGLAGGRGRVATRSSTGRRRRRGGTVGLDARVDDGVDLADALLGDALADGGHLGYDGRAEAAGGVLLGLQVLGDDGRHAELVEDGLLGYQGADGLVGRGGQARGGLLQGEGVRQGERVGALDRGGRRLDDILGVGAGGEDALQGVGVCCADGLLVGWDVSVKFRVKIWEDRMRWLSKDSHRLRCRGHQGTFARCQ